MSAYAIDPKTGKLHLLNTLPTGGTSTCYLSIDKTGHYAMMANFGSSSVTVIRINDDGSLGEQTAFMKHIGQGQGRVLPVQGASAFDRCFAGQPFCRRLRSGSRQGFRLSIRRGDGHAFAGRSAVRRRGVRRRPASFCFRFSGKFGYSLHEMSGFVTVHGMGCREREVHQSAGCQDIGVRFHWLQRQRRNRDPSQRKFLYESNRRSAAPICGGPDSIGVFAIDPVKGT